MDSSAHLLAANIPLFNELTPMELQSLASFLFVRTIAPGEVVFREGTHGNAVCFVVEGELEVFKTRAEREHTIATLTKGQSVGEMSIIDGMMRSATIRALTKATVLILKRDDFQKIIDENPQIGIKVLKAVSRVLSSNLRKTSEAFSVLMASIAG
jgi:CRP-like cAMP-binding protein